MDEYKPQYVHILSGPKATVQTLSWHLWPVVQAPRRPTTTSPQSVLESIFVWKSHCKRPLLSLGKTSKSSTEMTHYRPRPSSGLTGHNNTSRCSCRRRVLHCPISFYLLLRFEKLDSIFRLFFLKWLNSIKPTRVGPNRNTLRQHLF